MRPTGTAMDDLKTFCCQNPQCSDYGCRGLDNLRVCFRNGPNKERRVLACRTCQQRFSERKGTALYRCKLSDDKAVSVLHHLQEGCGVRQTSGVVQVNKNSVARRVCRTPQSSWGGCSTETALSSESLQRYRA